MAIYKVNTAPFKARKGDIIDRVCRNEDGSEYRHPVKVLSWGKKQCVVIDLDWVDNNHFGGAQYPLDNGRSIATVRHNSYFESQKGGAA